MRLDELHGLTDDEKRMAVRMWAESDGCWTIFDPRTPDYMVGRGDADAIIKACRLYDEIQAEAFNPQRRILIVVAELKTGAFAAAWLSGWSPVLVTQLLVLALIPMLVRHYRSTRAAKSFGS